MHRAPRFATAALAGLALLGLACQQTKLTQVWESQEQLTVGEFGYQKLLVLGLTDNLERRRTFEYEFVVQLEANDIDAIPSLELLAPDDRPERAVIQPKLEAHGIDAVLVVRATGTGSGRSQTVGRQNLGFYGYYSRYYPVEAIDYQTLDLESSLYDAESALLMWQAESETFDPVGVKAVARSLAKVVIENLQSKGLVR